MTSTQRPHTQVDNVVDTYLDEYAALDPIFATAKGIPGHDSELPELSPDWLATVSALRRRTLAALAAATPVDATDRVTVAAATGEFENAEEIRASGAEESQLNIIASPLQEVRMVFDLMATSSADDWAAVAARLARVPDAIGGYIASLRTAAARGDIAPRRQVEAGIKQCRDNTGPDGYFARLAGGAALGNGTSTAHGNGAARGNGAGADDARGNGAGAARGNGAGAARGNGAGADDARGNGAADGAADRSIRADLDRGARAAADAYEQLAAFLATELLPVAPTSDPVGRDRYALFSRSFLGSTIDLEESYAWGRHELARIDTLMRQTARRIKPGATVREAMEHLDSDPGHRLYGTEALRTWMQERSDAAVDALAGTHFDIPDPIRTLECRIAPTTTGGMYYTGPSDDFARPGRMWWSVPSGVTEFSTWRELSIVYHEGVPGHHLQVAQTVYRRELLNRWRRLGSWVSGHGEGWALYAEWLMADLGFLDEPGDFLGMLDSQSLRAARVVIDIGVHCGFDAPDEVGGGAWDYDKAWQFLTAHSSSSQELLRHELDRYLGWPGQAPSYKLGERLWLQLRDDARRRAGANFDLKAFHRRALDIGSVGLDALRAAVLPS